MERIVAEHEHVGGVGYEESGVEEVVLEATIVISPLKQVKRVEIGVDGSVSAVGNVWSYGGKIRGDQESLCDI